MGIKKIKFFGSDPQETVAMAKQIMEDFERKGMINTGGTITYPMDFHRILTQEEKDLVKDYADYIRWGFSPATIRAEFWHWKIGDLKAKAKVCYLLEECNWHTLCRYLINGEEQKAKEWIDNEMPFETEG